MDLSQQRILPVFLLILFYLSSGGVALAQDVEIAAAQGLPAEESPAGESSEESKAQQKPEELPRFDIWEYQVKGNTLLARAVIERAAYHFLGAQKTIKDIEAARGYLEQLYHDAGYPTVLVNIPEQKVSNGIVRLEVVEGRIGQLRITGSAYHSLTRIRQQVPAIKEGGIPHFPSLQTELAELNMQTGDRSISPVLRAGRTPGTVDIELKVKDELPLHGSIELNDRHSADTTDLRLSAMLRYDNLWQKQHSLSLQYQTSPQDTDEVKVWSGTYLSRFEDSSNLLAVYGVKSESNTATVGDLLVIGNGDILGVRAIFPLLAQQDYFHSLSLGIDYKSFDESLVLQGADTLTTPIDYANWSAQYNGTQIDENSKTQFDIGANFGIRGVSNDEQEFDDKRFKAKPNYFYLRGNVQHSRKLFKESTLLAKLSAQMSDSPLISNEQFSAGGADSVRGYFESMALGDNGVQFNLEWHTPSFAERLSSRVQDLHMLVFADCAGLRTRNPLPGQTDHYELYGAGIGVRLTAFKGLNIMLDWVRALKELGEVDKNDDRIHGFIEYAF